MEKKNNKRYYFDDTLFMFELILYMATDKAFTKYINFNN